MIRPGQYSISVSLVTLAIAVAASSDGLAQQSDLRDLAAKMPNGANAVMALNVEQIRQSALAQQNGWFNTATGLSQSGMNLLPPGTDLVLMTANMDFQTVSTRWNASLFNKSKVPSVAEIREMTDGWVDELLGKQFVETPDDFFVIPLNDTTMAAFQPAMRQDFARWMRRLVVGQDPRIRDYLEQGLGFADAGTDLVMAFNLENMISRNDAAERSLSSEKLRANSIMPGDFSRLLSSVRGVSLKADVTDKIACTIKMEFGEDISMLAPIAAPLTQELVEIAGVYLPEFEQWTPVVEGDKLSISGELSVNSFRKIISLFDGPRSEGIATADEYQSYNYDDPLEATKNYFNAVNSLVDSVQPRIRPEQAFSRNARWFSAYANKIDNLPTLNVDPIVLDFGNFVSDSFRDMSMGLITTREAGNATNRNLLAAGSGRGASRRRSAARQNRRSVVNVTVADLFSQIATVTREVRRQMTEKYGVQF